jgi:hypothetical protein
MKVHRLASVAGLAAALFAASPMSAQQQQDPQRRHEAGTTEQQTQEQRRIEQQRRQLEQQRQTGQQEDWRFQRDHMQQEDWRIQRDPAMRRTQVGTQTRIFAIQDRQGEMQLRQVNQQLEQMEQQMHQLSQRTQQQLQQAQAQQGEQKVDGLVQVVQNITQEHQVLHRYLTELRTTITGDTRTSGQQDPWQRDRFERRDEWRQERDDWQQQRDQWQRDRTRQDRDEWFQQRDEWQDQRDQWQQQRRGQGQVGQQQRQQVLREAQQHLPPREAERIITQLETGRLDQQQRQQIIQTLTTHARMERTEAQQTVMRWERTLSQEQQFGQQEQFGQQQRGQQGRQQVLREAQQHLPPREAERIVSQLETGRLDQRQRQQIIQTLTTEARMERTEAQQTVMRWERTLSQQEQFGQQQQFGQQEQFGQQQRGQQGREQVLREAQQFLHPQQAQRIITQLESGRIDQQQRQQLVQILTTQARMERNEAQQTIVRWERMLSQEGQQGQQVHGRIFAIEDPNAEMQLMQYSRRLEQYEQQMMQISQRTQQQLQQAQRAQGEQKIEALTQVIGLLVQEHQILHRYLSELRTLITGEEATMRFDRRFEMQDPWMRDEQFQQEEWRFEERQQRDLDERIDWDADPMSPRRR